jgi:hypothetical protein
LPQRAYALAATLFVGLAGKNDDYAPAVLTIKKLKKLRSPAWRDAPIERPDIRRLKNYFDREKRRFGGKTFPIIRAPNAVFGLSFWPKARGRPQKNWPKPFGP